MSLADILKDAPAPSKAEREDAAEAADRLGVSVADVKALRDSLGCHFSEIVSYDATDEGPVAVTHDGVAMIFRGESNPDAAGNAGWLYLERPDKGARREQDGSHPEYAVPVFKPIPEPAEPEEETAYGALRKAELVAVIKARNAERGEDDQLPTGTVAEMVAVLEADDEAGE